MFVGDRSQLHGKTAGRMARRHVNCHLFIWKSAPNHLNSRNKIRITAYQHELVANILIGIVQHVHSNIYIGALLLKSLEKAISRVVARRQTAFNALSFEVSQDGLDYRSRRQSLEVNFLVRLCSAVYHCGEIPNALNCVVGAHQAEEFMQVEPLVWSPF